MFLEHIEHSKINYMDFHKSPHFYFKTDNINNTKIRNFFCFSTQPLVHANNMSNRPVRRHHRQLKSDIFQMLYWYNWFSWWWAQGCSKHVRKWNKCIRIVSQVGYLQDLPDLCCSLITWQCNLPPYSCTWQYNQLTYLLTPWSRVLLEKLTVCS
jgi:hypothetical protein